MYQKRNVNTDIAFRKKQNAQKSVKSNVAFKFLSVTENSGC